MTNTLRNRSRGILLIIPLIVLLLLAFTPQACSNGPTAPAGDSRVDTVKVIVHDTVRVDVQGTPDYYNALQQYVRGVLETEGLYSYFPALETEDIIISEISATKLSIDIYWIAINFELGEIYLYAGVFEVNYQGGKYDIVETTPTGKRTTRTFPVDAFRTF